MRFTSTVGAFALLSYTAPTVVAWGAVGHEIAATIAQIYLHPTALSNICSILNPSASPGGESECHLASIAAWADKIRFKMRWSAGLHYVGALGDHPSETCLYPGERGWAGRKDANVLGGIRNTTNILQGWRDVDEGMSNEALKFLVHFLGDLHQPLHLTGRDRGGNSDKVLFDNRQTNLHTLWDSGLIAKTLRTIPRNYTHPLPIPEIESQLRDTIYDPYIRRTMYEGVLGLWKDEIEDWFDCPQPSSSPELETPSQRVLGDERVIYGGEGTDDDLVCPFHWSEPIHAMNCAFIWPKALDEPPYTHATDSDSALPALSHHEHDGGGCHSRSVEEEIADFDESGTFVNGELSGAAVGYAPRRGRGSAGGGGGSPYLELDTPEYAGYIAKRFVIEKLLAQAGVRLAGVLNWLFADDEGEEFRGGPWVVRF